jgi:hypothetical protein
MLIATVIACTESGDSEPSNAFTTKGKTFALTNGYIQGFGDGSYWVILADGAFDSLYYTAGRSGLSLLFQSPDEASLAEGQYQFSDDDDPKNREFTGEIYLYDSAFFNIDSGSVIISGSGSSLNFSFDLKYNNIQSLTGIYNGSLTEFDAEDIPEGAGQSD